MHPCRPLTDLIRLARCLTTVAGIALSAPLLTGTAAAAPQGGGPPESREAAIALLRRYDGPSRQGVDRSTLDGKVMAGYQGWFTCPGDGSGRGWGHYGRRREFGPGHCTIDLWPDVSELPAGERFATSFAYADGRKAEVFSSHHPDTVDRHFRWMREYGIDGVFVQRFGVTTRSVRGLHHCNRVLANCRAGANRHGRAYALMYDLSGLRAGETRIVVEDFKQLVGRFHLGKDAAYLRHRGKPVVAVWGIGFGDGRQYGLDECERLVRFLQEDPEYGGWTVMLGVPTHWRTLRRDAVNDPRLHRIIRRVDVVSPWTVGRYASTEEVTRHGEQTLRQDLAWCRAAKLDYMPVVFPGFSWHNLRPGSPLDQIPRRGGAFLWEQMVGAKRRGARMIYVAMFDEIDEGTAIFKCTDKPPPGAFLDLEGRRSDYYLWLTGAGARMLRGEIDEAWPERRVERRVR